MVEHIVPTTLKEALEYIDQEYTQIVAGGTDLMVQKRNWASLPPMFDRDVVYIFNLQELHYIREDESNIYIGATTPLSEMLGHPLIPNLLQEAIKIIASPALRNMATIPGNIGNASPAGDTLPVLYLLDALVRVSSIHSEKIIPIEQLIKGPRKTILENNEMMTEVILPKETFTIETFRKVGGRKADAISKVSFCGAATIINHKVLDLRITFGAVAPVVIRNKSIEQSYTNQTVEYLQEHLDDVIEQYNKHITPIDDQRSNKHYRTTVAINLLREFIHNL